MVDYGPSGGFDDAEKVFFGLGTQKHAQHRLVMTTTTPTSSDQLTVHEE